MDVEGATTLAATEAVAAGLEEEAAFEGVGDALGTVTVTFTCAFQRRHLLVTLPLCTWGSTATRTVRLSIRRDAHAYSARAARNRSIATVHKPIQTHWTAFCRTATRNKISKTRTSTATTFQPLNSRLSGIVTVFTTLTVLRM